MTELNVPSYCADLAEFTDAFVERVDEEEGLLVLYGSQELPVGESDKSVERESLQAIEWRRKCVIGAGWATKCYSY